MVSTGSVITTKEARKLLGYKAKNLTNEELSTLVQDTETVVRMVLHGFLRSKNMKNDTIYTETEES